MNDNEKEVALGKVVGWSFTAFFLLGALSIISVNVYNDWSKIQIADREVSIAKARAEQSMFESVKRADPAPK